MALSSADCYNVKQLTFFCILWQTSDILYYEVLDIPLPELQGLKTLKVAFHHATKDEVSKLIKFLQTDSLTLHSLFMLKHLVHLYLGGGS